MYKYENICVHVYSTCMEHALTEQLPLKYIQLTVSSVFTSSEVNISVSAVLGAAGGVGEVASGRVSLAVE